MPAPADFLSALGMAFTGYGKDQSLRDAAEERAAVEQQRLAAQLAARQEKARGDYLKGFRPGTAPDQSGMPAFDAQAHDMFDLSKLGVTNAPNAYDTMLAADPERNAVNRYQQVDPSTYVDTAMTPEAVATRKGRDTDALKEQRARLDRARKVRDMVGTTLPNGQVVDERLANVILDSPTIGAAFARPAQQPKPDSVQIVQGVGPDGKPKFFRVNKNGGDATEVGGLEPKPAGVGSAERSGMAAAFLSRLKMGKGDFDNGMQFIREYHQKLAHGQEQITPAMMAESAAASTGPNPDAHGAFAGLSNAGTAMMQGVANNTLASSHSDYQRYVNLLNSMSLAMTEVLPRPTAQILGIEKGINTAKAGDGPERLADIQHRLDKAYEYLFSNPEGMLQRSGGAPASGPIKPPLSLRVQQLKAQGLSKEAARAQLSQEGYDLHGGD